MDPITARLDRLSAHLQAMREVAMFGLALIVVIVTAGSGGSAVSASEPTPSPEPATPAEPTPAQDVRVQAFADAYAALIDSVTYADDDVVFHLGASPIHFRDGRMLAEDRLDVGEACDPIFYRYSLAPLTELPPPPPETLPRYCTHVQESLWGASEREIRAHGRSVLFLGHRMFVNEFLVEPLAAVESELREAARDDSAVAGWIEALSVTYSFLYRDIAGSPTRSPHAWGMAVDLVPRSYGGRHVYWRWSRAMDRDGWHRIPLDRRWRPPTAVVETFEQHGFVWGGKWTLFDMIHFEYRPALVRYNRIVEAG